MTSVEFLGVGEALDGENYNASYLVRAGPTLLIDCGFAIPSRLFTKDLDPDEIDGVYFTHFHADHIFGAPAFLLDLSVRKRTKELTIIGQPGTKERLETLCSLAYQTVLPNLPFTLNFTETTGAFEWGGLSFAFAPTIHTMSNYAIRITAGRQVLGFSGDGDFTCESEELFRSCTFLVHEAFLPDEEYPNHASAVGAIRYAAGLTSLDTLALVHFQAAARKERLHDFEKLLPSAPCKVIIPRPGDRIELE
jgi:ribonuclease Z